MSGEVSAFIDDGYTETAFVKGIKGVHPDVSIEFRPMLVVEQAQCRKEWLKLEKAEDIEGQRKLYALWIAKQVRSWDVVKRGGGLVPITAENALKLKDPLFFRLYNIVQVSEVGDDKPAPVDAEGNPKAGHLLESEDAKN